MGVGVRIKIPVVLIVLGCLAVHIVAAADPPKPRPSVKSFIKLPPPPLEVKRVAEEKQLAAGDDAVQVVTGFPCSTPLKIEKLSPTHFAVTITTETELKNWFMFKVEGARGRTVRIDIKDSPLGKWWSLNPVCSNIASLDDPAGFVAAVPSEKRDPVNGYNGPSLPNTAGQKWEYIVDVWAENAGEKNIGTYCFVHTFDADSTYIAMKTPYTPKLNEAILDAIKRPGYALVEVGKSKAGSRLLLAEVGEGDPKKTPTIVMYAREHADEPDGSWVVLGAMESVLGDDERAKALRQQFTFIFIPLLDPDGAVASKYENFTHGFVYGARAGPEPLRWADYFRHWVDAGKRLDMVYNFHNVESAEYRHVFSIVKEGRKVRVDAGWNLDETYLRPRLKEQGFEMEPREHKGGDIARFRLGGYLAFFNGPLHMPYEINSQERSRHLTLLELKALGATFLDAGGEFLASPQAADLQAAIADTLQQRQQRIKTYSPLFKNLNDPLQIEWITHLKDQDAKAATRPTTRLGQPTTSATQPAAR